MVEVKYERKKRDIPRENQRNYKEKGLGGGGVLKSRENR